MKLTSDIEPGLAGVPLLSWANTDLHPNSNTHKENLVLGYSSTNFLCSMFYVSMYKHLFQIKPVFQ